MGPLRAWLEDQACVGRGSAAGRLGVAFLPTDINTEFTQSPTETTTRELASAL